MIIYKIGLFLLVSNSIGFSRKIKSLELDDSISNPMGWIFDIEENNVQENENELRETETVCRTKECRVIANEFLSSMNKAANPCDDFYEFTCGGWSVSDIPAYLPFWARHVMFQEVVWKRLKGILEMDQQPDDILPVKQAKKWFKICMDSEGLNSRGIRTLESILMRVGGWPITMDPEEWDADSYNWEKIDNYYFQLTSSHIFYKYQISSFTRAPKEDIGISPGDLPLADKLSSQYRNYTGNDYNAYKEFVYKVVEIFYKHNKGQSPGDVIQQDVIDLVEFEKKLYMIQDQDPEFEMSVISEFIENYEKQLKQSNDDDFKIDFKKSMSDLVDLIGYKYNDSTEISVQDKNYFVKLSKLLKKTPKKVIINYMHWHFVSNTIEHTTDEMRNLIFELMEKEYGVTERSPRWIECVRLTKMNDALSYAFMKKYFPAETENKVREMINNLVDSIATMIDNSNFGEADLKKTLIKKLKNTKFAIGFPDWYKNKTAVVSAFRGLTIGSDLLDDHLSYDRFVVKSNLRKLLTGSPQESWFSKEDPLTVDARYTTGQVIIPAALFQPPFFSPNIPEYLNYAMVGSSLGHEMGHGYDITDILFDENVERISFSEETQATLTDRIECFIQQYNKLLNASDETEGEEPSSGFKTLSENLSDAMGVHSMYDAYKMAVSKNPRADVKLPGFEEFTDDQILFISYGNIWCEVVNEQFAKSRAKKDSHSSGRIRLLGSLMNSEEFSRAFNCPKGSPMNPEKKCNMWGAEVKAESRRRFKKRHPGS
ncbi:membrane metallo-endopeptidase-like 1 [Microplitis mediator]|uniref:membrane metallo-endopeptidase-like 1 n=1 Tax=Microplitis mediator TaxID=375433 RepID=UPI002556B92E|nr:membrane metallo-endopeptidase-like 1 [Microplitis mediator]